jgi:hypothetical protein
MRPAKYGASPALFRPVGNYNEAGVQDNYAGVYVHCSGHYPGSGERPLNPKLK